MADARTWAGRVVRAMGDAWQGGVPKPPQAFGGPAVFAATCLLLGIVALLVLVAGH